jgi:CRP-like cAMP-binding protein
VILSESLRDTQATESWWPVFPTGNYVLDSFSLPLRKAVLDAARPCELKLKTVLVRQGRVPTNLVFPTSGMASLVVTMLEGNGAEVGMLGHESVTGVSTLLGADMSHAECIVQIAGFGLQVNRQHLLALFESSEEFRVCMLQVAQSQMNISAQLSACNLRHQTEARFARWLLTAMDRTDLSVLKTTQEFFSQMLGTRRTTLSTIAGSLQDRGIIQYRHGTVHVLDRPGLLEVACECYEICRKSMYPNVLKHPTGAGNKHDEIFMEPTNK